MKVKYEDSIEKKLSDRIDAIKSDVILRKDLEGIAAYRQISRALKKLIAQQKLVRIGSGLYAKAYKSKYTKFALIRGGTDSTLRTVLDRLKVRYEQSSAEQAYNAGKSTQVPAFNMVRLKGRCRRKIYYREAKLLFEENKNAK